MDIRDRAFRRNQTIRAKRKALIVLKDSWDYNPKDVDPRNIGKVASTHGKPCSCWMCGNPRRYFGELTVQERRFHQ